jgi:hypothetical protein
VTQSSWRESQPSLSGDRRYASPLLTSEQKEKLFRKHLQKLMTVRARPHITSWRVDG